MIEEFLTEEQAIADDQRQAAEWAVNLLKRDDWVILDSETTGLYQAEICQIAVIDCAGGTKLDTLVKPTVSISPPATKVHGITDEMVQDAPVFPDVYPFLRDAIADKFVLIYNQEFDTAVLDHCCSLHHLPSLWRVRDGEHNAQCAMHWYSQWVGDYSDYHGNYRWQKLRGDHTALGDCREVLRLIRLMAGESA